MLPLVVLFRCTFSIFIFFNFSFYLSLEVPDRIKSRNFDNSNGMCQFVAKNNTNVECFLWNVFQNGYYFLNLLKEFPQNYICLKNEGTIDYLKRLFLLLARKRCSQTTKDLSVIITCTLFKVSTTWTED